VNPDDRASVSVLLVEDDASMAKLMRHLLERDGYRRIRHVYTGEQALAAVGEADILLLDHQLPDIRGIELLPRLLGRADPPSVIMVTGHGSESLAATALRQGADDYITKDHSLPELLPRILERVRRNRALQRALAAAESELLLTERLAGVGEMTVALHHAIANPLMAAMAEIEMLLMDSSLPVTSREALQAVRTSLGRIAEAVRERAETEPADGDPYLRSLNGVEVSLQVAGREKHPYRGEALLLSPDLRVARVLTLLLRNAGFTVQRPLSMPDLQEAAMGPGVRLIVVAAGSDPLEPLDGFVPAASRPYAVVVLGNEHEAHARAAGADCVIALPFDPSSITKEILAAVGNASAPPPGT
jgi:DNA-binding response OmpR family regulator